MDFDIIFIGAGGAGITASLTANTVHQLTKLRNLGIDIIGDYEINTSGVMDHVRDVIHEVYEEEKPEVFEEKGKVSREISFDKVLFATGRNVNFEGLSLDEVGIAYSKKGIKVNNSLETSMENIYACGYVVGPYRFSHMAEYQGVIAALNCIIPINRKVNYDNVPWTTFSDPELAHIGLSEEESRGQLGNKLKVHKYPYAKKE